MENPLHIESHMLFKRTCEPVPVTLNRKTLEVQIVGKPPLGCNLQVSAELKSTSGEISDSNNLDDYNVCFKISCRTPGCRINCNKMP